MKATAGMRTTRPARGFALITSLILMTGLLVLAAVTLRVSTRNERVAGIDMDRALAFQLAETTLRDAQQDILRMNATGQPCIPPTVCRPEAEYPNKDSGLTALPFIGTCRQGMCYLGPGSVTPTGTNPAGQAYLATGFQNPWDRADPGSTNADRPYAQYGEFTGASWSTLQTATGAAQRPRYWVELIPYGTAGDRMLYRITVLATGRNPQSLAMLQEVYQPN
jgi:Tfp pilus assembly protein PilX